MKNEWITQEWEDVCGRLNQCVDARDSQVLRMQAKQFAQQPAPSSYQELLDRVGEAAKLAIANRDESASTSDRVAPFDPDHGIIDAIDEAGLESFPASDSPAY